MNCPFFIRISPSWNDFQVPIREMVSESGISKDGNNLCMTSGLGIMVEGRIDYGCLMAFSSTHVDHQNLNITWIDS